MPLLRLAARAASSVSQGRKQRPQASECILTILTHSFSLNLILSRLHICLHRRPIQAPRLPQCRLGLQLQLAAALTKEILRNY